MRWGLSGRALLRMPTERARCSWQARRSHFRWRSCCAAAICSTGPKRLRAAADASDDTADPPWPCRAILRRGFDELSWSAFQNLDGRRLLRWRDRGPAPGPPGYLRREEEGDDPGAMSDGDGEVSS